MTTVAEKYERDGFFILEKSIPEHVVDAYLDMYQAEHGDSLAGWGRSEQYNKHVEIKDVLCHPSIEDAFSQIEMAAALHIEMTMQKSTECKWHKDSVLQDPFAASTYIGVFVCLEDIDPSSGPFEVIPGSHKWDNLVPLMTREIIEQPNIGEELMETLILEEAEKRNSDVFTFLGKKGDVLIWHSQLAHRGSPVSGKERRKTVIGHYCGNYSHDLHKGPLPEYQTRVAEMQKQTERYARHGEGGVMYFREVEW